MSKVLIFTDSHVHPHKSSQDRLKDCLNALEWVFKTATEKNVSNILFIGDLFHERQKIDVLTYQRTFELFEKYICEDLPIHLLLGNHDLWHCDKWDISSVFPLRTIPGVRVVDRPCTIKIAGHPISFLPYTHDPAGDLAKIENNSKWKILLGHVAINGSVLNTMHGTRAEVSIEHDGDMVKVDPDIFIGWNQVFLGHYHAQQKMREFPFVEYVGSPLQLSFGEAFQDKHIIILDLETHKKEYIVNDFSPKHLIIHQRDLHKHDLAGNFVRVMVDDLSKSDVAELSHDIVSGTKLGSLQITQVEAPEEDNENLIVEAKEILARKSDMLQNYLELEAKRGNVQESEKKKLFEVGTLICQSVIR